mgnify:CR=1 FL=1
MGNQGSGGGGEQAERGDTVLARPSVEHRAPEEEGADQERQMLGDVPAVVVGAGDCDRPYTTNISTAPAASPPRAQYGQLGLLGGAAS